MVNIDHAEAAALYQNRLVLVRPDGSVAWRADAVAGDTAQRVVDTARGAVSPVPAQLKRRDYELAEA